MFDTIVLGDSEAVANQSVFDVEPHLGWGLDTMGPGLPLAAVLESLDVSGLEGHDRIVVLRAIQRLVSHFTAMLYETMCGVVDAYMDEVDADLHDAAEGATAEISAALHLTRRCAEADVNLALALKRRLPIVQAALRDGRIDARRARVLVGATIHLDSATAEDVVAGIIDQAPCLTTGQLRARLRTACVSADPDEASRRYASAVDDRRVVAEPQDDGTCHLLGLNLPPHRATAAVNHVNALARQLRRSGETRTMDQLRADVLCDLLTGVRTPDRVTTGVEIRVDLATLAGLDDHPGELAGYGPVIADIARQVADNARSRRWTLVETGTGAVLDVGTTRRRPTASGRRRIEARYPTCVFPGCRVASTRCDLDHRTPWADGGATHEDNLAPLCRHHHRIRHHHGWAHTAAADGTVTWHSPLHHRYPTPGPSP